MQRLLPASFAVHLHVSYGLRFSVTDGVCLFGARDGATQMRRLFRAPVDNLTDLNCCSSFLDTKGVQVCALKARLREHFLKKIVMEIPKGGTSRDLQMMASHAEYRLSRPAEIQPSLRRDRRLFRKFHGKWAERFVAEIAVDSGRRLVLCKSLIWSPLRHALIASGHLRRLMNGGRPINFFPSDDLSIFSPWLFVLRS
jgi:hypothetical protein